MATDLIVGCAYLIGIIMGFALCAVITANNDHDNTTGTT